MKFWISENDPYQGLLTGTNGAAGLEKPDVERLPRGRGRNLAGDEPCGDHENLVPHRQLGQVWGVAAARKAVADFEDSALRKEVVVREDGQVSSVNAVDLDPDSMCDWGPVSASTTDSFADDPDEDFEILVSEALREAGQDTLGQLSSRRDVPRREAIGHPWERSAEVVDGWRVQSSGLDRIEVPSEGV